MCITNPKPRPEGHTQLEGAPRPIGHHDGGSQGVGVGVAVVEVNRLDVAHGGAQPVVVAPPDPFLGCAVGQRRAAHVDVCGYAVPTPSGASLERDGGAVLFTRRPDRRTQSGARVVAAFVAAVVAVAAFAGSRLGGRDRMFSARMRRLAVAVAAVLVLPVSSAAAVTFTEGEPSDPVLGTLRVDCDAGPSTCPRDFAGTIDWGDGSPTDAAAFARSSAQCAPDPNSGDSICTFQVSGSHAYGEEGSYTGHFTYSYTDVNGPRSGTRPVAATVSDAPLVDAAGFVDLIGYEAVPFPPGGAALATFADQNPGATSSDFTATINWGDGSPTDTGTVRAVAGGFEVLGSHTYGFPGNGDDRD